MANRRVRCRATDGRFRGTGCACFQIVLLLPLCNDLARRPMKKLLTALLVASTLAPAAAADLNKAIAQDYDAHLGALFDWFHRNPELSFLETKTAARLAQELRAAGFEVTEGVGGTGVVAILKNGP